MKGNYLIYFFPFIGAFIGYLTNYIAVKMLFHPKNEISFFFMRFQGVFPKRQKILAKKIGEIVSNELFSIDNVKTKLNDKANSPETIQKIEKHIDIFLNKKLSKTFPMLKIIKNTKLHKMIRNVLMNELREIIKIMVENMGHELEEAVDIHEIVQQKVESFSSDKLEEILFSIMKNEFKFIEIIGGFLGFLIGIIQTALFLFQKGDLHFF